jgi:UDPglucose 6-dehydrogenase
MHIAMIGSGHVGLVSDTCLADFGHDIVCVDKDAAKIAALQRGEIPIFEAGLDDLIANNVHQGRHSSTTIWQNR